jgi:ubiquinone/menaquinone biosynthesis C-methylase UbiE
LKDDFFIKTFDLDKKLEPDYIGDVSRISLPDNSFELVCCFQVLEHLPFRNLEQSLEELARVSQKYVLLSLPYSRIDFKFELKLPLLKKRSMLFTIPKFYKTHVFDGQHYWEIGTKGYSKNKIINVLRKYFIIEEINHPYENPYHIFFKLKT